MDGLLFTVVSSGTRLDVAKVLTLFVLVNGAVKIHTEHLPMQIQAIHPYVRIVEPPHTQETWFDPNSPRNESNAEVGSGWGLIIAPRPAIAIGTTALPTVVSSGAALGS